MASATVRIYSYVRGYHVYKGIWSPFIGEIATTAIENGNIHDRYAVAVLESETLCCVGHIPREISRECYFFLRTGGRIKVLLTGKRRRSDLPQGGLEVPCKEQHDEHVSILKFKFLISNLLCQFSNSASK